MAPAPSPPLQPPPYSISTDRIVLERSVSVEGMRVERYCSGQGSPCYIDEESLETLGNYLRETGLVQSIREMGTFRFLVPSMCDHDLYMGLGIVDDPYNPNIDANGQRPRADGYNTHDRVFACQPVDQVTITDPTGNSYSGSGMQLAYLRVNEALRASPLMAVSRIHEVCVGRDPQRGECFVHIPTIRASSQVGGDRYRGGEDYNAVIVAWVRERLGDPRPPLATSP